MNNKHRSFLAVLLLVFSAASAGESNGPVSTIWDSTFQLRVGVFFPDLDSHIRIDSSFDRIGDGIDFEQDLGMSESKTTFMEALPGNLPTSTSLNGSFSI